MPSEANSQGNGWVAETLEGPLGRDRCPWRWTGGACLGLSIYWEQPPRGWRWPASELQAWKRPPIGRRPSRCSRAWATAGFDWPAGAPRPPGPWFGGLAFDLSQTLTNGWTGFPLARWLLPELLVWTRGGQTFLTVLRPPGRGGREQLRRGSRTSGAGCPRAAASPPSRAARWRCARNRGGLGPADRTSRSPPLEPGCSPRWWLARAHRRHLRSGLRRAGGAGPAAGAAPSCTTFLFRGRTARASWAPRRRRCAGWTGGVLETEALAGSAAPGGARRLAASGQGPARARRGGATTSSQALRPLATRVDADAQPAVLALQERGAPAHAASARGCARAWAPREVVDGAAPHARGGRHAARARARRSCASTRRWTAAGTRAPVGWVGAGRARPRGGAALGAGARARRPGSSSARASSRAPARRREWQETEMKSLAMLRALGGRR